MNGLWTVTHLPVGMDRLRTAKDKWTDWNGCPQSTHTYLGQVIEWMSDLTTAAWKTARLVTAVSHTDHSKNDDEIFLKLGIRKKEVERTESSGQTQGQLSQITPWIKYHISVDGDYTIQLCFGY